MNDDVRELPNPEYRPTLVGPQPFSPDEVLRYTDPAPDEGTENFVAAIYADRKPARDNSSSK